MALLLYTDKCTKPTRPPFVETPDTLFKNFYTDPQWRDLLAIKNTFFVSSSECHLIQNSGASQSDISGSHEAAVVAYQAVPRSHSERILSYRSYSAGFHHHFHHPSS